MAERITAVSQKLTDTEFGTKIPIGTSGKYVSMDSGLDLEQEVKLGVSHGAKIETDISGTTTITEDFTKLDDNWQGSGEWYRMITIISTNGNGDTVIDAGLYNVKDNVVESAPIKSKSTVISSTEDDTSIKEVTT